MRGLLLGTVAALGFLLTREADAQTREQYRQMQLQWLQSAQQKQRANGPCGMAGFIVVNGTCVPTDYSGNPLYIPLTPQQVEEQRRKDAERAAEQAARTNNAVNDAINSVTTYRKGHPKTPSSPEDVARCIREGQARVSHQYNILFHGAMSGTSDPYGMIRDSFTNDMAQEMNVVKWKCEENPNVRPY